MTKQYDTVKAHEDRGLPVDPIDEVVRRFLLILSWVGVGIIALIAALDKNKIIAKEKFAAIYYSLTSFILTTDLFGVAWPSLFRPLLILPLLGIAYALYLPFWIAYGFGSYVRIE